MCVCVFYIVKAPRSGAFSYSLLNRLNNYVNPNELSMFKALHKGFK